MREVVLNSLLAVIALIAMIMIALVAIDYVLELPHVQFDWATKDCVSVLHTVASVYDCENLPDHYHHVWVSR